MKLLSYDELRPKKGIPYSKVHLWRLERDGKFPKRVPLGESRHGWLESEIDDWLLERMATRNVTPRERDRLDTKLILTPVPGKKTPASCQAEPSEERKKRCLTSQGGRAPQAGI